MGLLRHELVRGWGRYTINSYAFTPYLRSTSSIDIKDEKFLALLNVFAEMGKEALVSLKDQIELYPEMFSDGY